MSQIEYASLTRTLLSEFPELKLRYEENEGYLEEEWAHLVFGIILEPYLILMLESNDNEEQLYRLFLFLEKLSKHQDPDVQDVVKHTIFGELGGRPELLTKARCYMGKATLRLLRECEKEK
jgi:hypothetical protein